MKKFWLSLMGFTMVATTSLTTISCATQPLGWSRNQYWMILDYSGFHDWMQNVDLISQNQWFSLSKDQKMKSWETVQNVDLNNFMTIINLAYSYLNQNSDPEKAEPRKIDELGGLYHNFGYAILSDKNSFAHHFLDLKYQNLPLIQENQWESLDETSYLNNFKSSQLDNKFIFHSVEEDSPIKMSITAGNSNIPANHQIVEVWNPIFSAIQTPKENNDDFVQQLWNGIISWSFEAFIFNFKIWPVEKEWPITLQINLTFDV